MPNKSDKRRKRWACLAGGLLLATAIVVETKDASASGDGSVLHETGQNMDLSMAWMLALENDHRYLAAISEQAAAQTERAQGRAELLPHIYAGYYVSKVNGSAVQYDQGQKLGSSLNYDSLNAYVQLQQPLLNAANYARYRRGGARADMGAAVFRAKYEETGMRLAQSYFDVLLAYDRYVLQQGLAQALQSRLGAVEALYRRQEATRIDVQETLSRLVVAQADEIEAEHQWLLALDELESMVGVSLTRVAVLRNDVPLAPLEPVVLDEWLQQALVRNAEIEAARQAIRVASIEIDLAASQYAPTVDLVATYGRAKSESLASLSQRSNSFSVGIEVSIPLFAEGYNRANVARSRSDHRRLQHELDAAIHRTQAEVVRQYTNVRSGADLIRALREAEASGELSLASAQKGFEVGVTSNLDVLKVQERLHQTRHDLATAELNYVLARLKLMVVSGLQQGNTFHEISRTYLGPLVAVVDGSPRNVLPAVTLSN